MYNSPTLYCIVDIETTGKTAREGKITEIAIFVHNGQKVIDSFSSLINPECHIPYFITKLTGIDDEMVKDSPRFYELAKKIVELTAGSIFVAHNASLDYRFVREEFSRLGYEYKRKTICTVKWGRKYLPGHASYSLGKLCSELDIPINGRHRAAGDALATVRLFEILLTKHEQENRDLRNTQLRLF